MPIQSDADEISWQRPSGAPGEQGHEDRDVDDHDHGGEEEDLANGADRHTSQLVLLRLLQAAVLAVAVVAVFGAARGAAAEAAAAAAPRPAAQDLAARRRVADEAHQASQGHGEEQAHVDYAPLCEKK